MQEQTAPDFPLPYAPEQKPPKKLLERYKLFVWIFAAVGFVLVAAVSTYLWVGRSDSGGASATRSITYYYRDGKTVLWRDTADPRAGGAAIFVDFVYGELLTQIGSKADRGGEWKIVTTLDNALQQTAKQEVEAQRDQLARQRAQDAALIAQDVTTGQIVSWVGSLDNPFPPKGADRVSARTEVNTLALPLVYATYIENNNAGAGTVVEDTQGALLGWPCTNPAPARSGGDCLFNFDNEYLGQMTLRQALGGLRLVPAAKAMLFAVPNDKSAGHIDSIDKTVATIETLMDNQNGFSCYPSSTDATQVSKELETQCYGASSFGDGAYSTPQSIIQAYATLANNGKRLPQTGLLRAELDGKTQYEWAAPKGKQAIQDDTAYIINDILSDPSASYMSSRKSSFKIGDNKVGIISGVASSGATASAVKYSSKYAVGFWAFAGQQPIVGFSESLTLPGLSGWLEAALAGGTHPAWAKPSGVQELASPVITLDTTAGSIGPSPATDLYPGWYK